MSKPVKLSKAVKRDLERQAAEEFFSRRNRPPTQFQPAPEQQQPTVKPPDGLSKDRPTWQESQEILKKLLAEGKLKTSR